MKQNLPEWYQIACRMAVRMHMNKYHGAPPDCEEMAKYCWEILHNYRHKIILEAMNETTENYSKLMKPESK